MATIRTMCPMSCHPTLCGMLVTVEGGRLVEVTGDPDNPDSRGFLCVRGHASREIIGNPQRLRTPLAREGRQGAFREITWDAALDRIASLMGAVGREAVGLWSGHGFFANNYGTRTVWMRDGWDGLDRLTSGEACIPDAAVDVFGFSAGQAAFDAAVEVAPV